MSTVYLRNGTGTRGYPHTEKQAKTNKQTKN